MNIETSLSVWTAFILTIIVFSGFFKSHPLYRFAESLFIGVSAGYFACVWLFSTIFSTFESAFNGEFLLFIPIFAGLLLLIPSNSGRFGSKLLFLPAAFIVILSISINVPIYFKVFLQEMVRTSIIPLISYDKSGNIQIDATINSVVSIVGTLSVLWFLISRRQRINKIQTFVGETGRFYILVALGVVFAYTLVSRTTLFIGRLDFIISDVFGIRF